MTQPSVFGRVVRSLRPYLSARDPSWLRLGRRGSVAFLLIGSLLIVAWQGQFIRNADDLPRTHPLGRFAASGFIPWCAPNYLYFLYYTGKFPVSIEGGGLRYERAAAERLLKNSPHLIMERHVCVRAGDLAKYFLLYPDAWLNGTPRGASLMSFNYILSLGSLLALFASLSLSNHRLLGVGLVGLIGSNPYQLEQLYFRNNVLGYPIAVAALMLALHAPLIVGRRPGRIVLVLPLLSGMFIATAREVRTELALVVLSVAAAYLFVGGSRRLRALLLVTLVATCSLTAEVWKTWWNYKFEEAYEIVEKAGGVTYDGIRNLHHAFWHPLWCGLGDFDTKYGYKWDDRAAHAYGIPIVNEKYGTKYQLMKRGFFVDNYYTESKKHRINPETIPEYLMVLKEKILHDITNDPAWYASIILKRIHRIFTKTTPIRLELGIHYVDIPFSAWLLLPALLLLAIVQRWEQIVLLLWFLPTSLVSLLIFSGRNHTYGSSFHLMLFVLMTCWLVNTVSRLSGRYLRPIGRGCEEASS